MAKLWSIFILVHRSIGTLIGQKGNER